MGFSVMLTALYGVLYSLLISQDNALLMGSLLLFGILVSIMWVTRKLDWYELDNSLRQGRHARSRTGSPAGATFEEAAVVVVAATRCGGSGQPPLAALRPGVVAESSSLTMQA